MSKKTSILILIPLMIVGSIIAFYSTNLILSDVSNMFYSSITKDFISSLPLFIVGFIFTFYTVFIIRAAIHPEYLKKMWIVHNYYIVGLSSLGLIASILTGAIIYHDFLAPYPFPGYTIINIVFDLIMLVGSLLLNVYLKKHMKEDTAKRHINFGYVVHSIVLVFMIFFSYNRLGALILSPIYIHWRTFYLTFPFYISLLLPIALMIHSALFMYDAYVKHQNVGIIMASIIIGLDVVITFIVCYLGYHNTQFISAISPVLPIERLITLPIDIILHSSFVLIFGIYELIYSIKFKKKLKEQHE